MTAVEAAERAARAFAARRRRGWAWREHWADAWLGVRNDAEPTVYGAYLGVVDGVRQDTGHRRRDRAERAAVVPLRGAAGVLAARESRPTPLAVWCEERPARWGWSWRSRVAVYLIAVEGLSLADAAALMGLSEQALSTHLNDRLPAWRRRPKPGRHGPAPAVTV